MMIWFYTLENPRRKNYGFSYKEMINEQSVVMQVFNLRTLEAEAGRTYTV